LFGSYATNHAGKWSDIDVAIVSPDFSNQMIVLMILFVL